MHPYYGPASQLLQMDGTWWLGIASMAMYLVFWGVVAAAGFWLMRRRWNAAPAVPEKQDSAVTLLRERYAKGELDAAEYREKLAVLQETADLPTGGAA